jgi:hypothetical protein
LHNARPASHRQAGPVSVTPEEERELSRTWFGF